MSVVQALLHVVSALLPALALALFTPLLGLWALPPNSRRALQLLGLCATIFGVCSLITFIGLILSGNDGKMLTYGAQVLAAGTLTWLWRWIAPKVR